MAWLYVPCCLVLLRAATAEDYSDNPSVQLFQQYIQINTTTHGDLTPAIEFWEKLAAKEKLLFNVYTYEKGYPVIVIKWQGTDPNLSSIVLNSHIDVVPAGVTEDWTHPPFSGYLTEDNVIWGRGSQDTKSVSIQYFEALSRLKAKNFECLRDVYMTLMPDEEAGSEYGMIPFLKSAEFRAMNMGLGMDEGAPYNIPEIPIFYQDKAVWQIQIDCYSATGSHGALIAETNSTATGKCINVINKLLSFRDEEYRKFLKAGITKAGEYTSVNLNEIQAGVAKNVVPNHMSVVFDIRLSTTVNEASFEEQLDEWITEAGDNITITYILKDTQSPATCIGSSNPYLSVITAATKQMGITVLPVVNPGATDSRYMRLAGFPAFGFSPMPNTDPLLHTTNERLKADIFLRGIDIYEPIIGNLANIPGDRTSADPSDYIMDTAVSN